MTTETNDRPSGESGPEIVDGAGSATTRTTKAGFAEAEQHRRRLIDICNTMAQIAVTLEPSVQTDVKEVATRVGDDAFKVMVVGNFKRGKSTLVNALLGAEVLPSFARPCTAVPTEVSYAEHPSAVLFGAEDGEATPLPIADLEREISIAAGDPDGANPYRLAQVMFPLEILESGVVLIDSPGLNEHPVRQRVTLEYLRHADAIVFVTDATAPWAMDEQNFVDIHLDPYDLFIAVNRINQVRRREVDDVKDFVRQRHRLLRGDRADADRMFFVNALAGLEARIGEGEPEDWVDSGMRAFENALHSFLTRDRHKAKIIASARSVRSVARRLQLRVPEQLALLDDDASQLQARYDEARAPLDDLQHRSALVRQRVEGRLTDLGAEVERMTATKLRSLADQCADLVEAAEPTIDFEVGLFAKKDAVAPFARELADLVSADMDRALASWIREMLEPAISASVEALLEEIADEVSQIDADFGRVRRGLLGAAAQHDTDDDSSGMLGRLQVTVPEIVAATTKERSAIAVLGGVGILTLAGTLWFLLPPLAAMGMFHFKDKAKERAVLQAKEHVANSISDALVKNAPAQAAELRAAADAELRPLAESVGSQLDGQLTDLKSAVETALDDRRKGEEAVTTRRAELHSQQGSIVDLLHELDDLISDVALL